MYLKLCTFIQDFLIGQRLRLYSHCRGEVQSWLKTRISHATHTAKKKKVMYLRPSCSDICGPAFLSRIVCPACVSAQLPVLLQTMVDLFEIWILPLLEITFFLIFSRILQLKFCENIYFPLKEEIGIRGWDWGKKQPLYII